jgi:hypothetical protein
MTAGMRAGAMVLILAVSLIIGALARFAWRLHTLRNVTNVE